MTALNHYRWDGLVLGMGPTPDGGDAPFCSGAENAALVLGPPRSGKTSAIVIPTILSAPGAVVSTSTKGDVLEATIAWRSKMGICYVFDPTGSIALPPYACELRWSPIPGCGDWDAAVAMAHSLAGAARPAAAMTEAAHWVERAEALLGPLLHAAALGQRTIADVCTWVLSQDVREPAAILETAGAKFARIVLSSIWRTEERERSGIFSTTSGVLSAYRSKRVLDAACSPNFDPHAFVASYSTVYVCAPAHAQDQLSPLIVAMVEQIRSATYERRLRQPDSAPVVFALDEVANIAPLPSLPAMAAEGGGQGLVTLACLQDLSQARARWGGVADGFFSLFSAKVILPGIGDARTLQLLSSLAGDHQVVMRSVSKPDLRSALAGKGHTSVNYSAIWRPRLSIDEINRGVPGTALCLMPGRDIERIRVVPWWNVAVWYQRVTGRS